MSSCPYYQIYVQSSTSTRHSQFHVHLAICASSYTRNMASSQSNVYLSLINNGNNNNGSQVYHRLNLSIGFGYFDTCNLY